MGQIHGSPTVNSAFKAFSNLPKDSMDSLFLAFNLQGETWGLGQDDIRGIFKNAAYFNDILRSKGGNDAVDTLFIAFDTDLNGKIDALEVLLALALISGMVAAEKLQYIFCLYDFDTRGGLSFHELSILIQAVFVASSKLFPTIAAFVPISLPQTEKFASLMFPNVDNINEPSNRQISSKEFQQYCLNHPIIKQWLAFYDNISSSSSNIALEQNSTIDRKVRVDFSMSSEVLDTISFPRNASPSFASSDISENASEIAARPWFADVDYSVPDEDAEPMDVPHVSAHPPEDLLSPMWVHGINCSKSNMSGDVASYLPKGDVVYSAGRHLLLLSKDGEGPWKQSIFSQHLHSIVSLLTHGSLILTGDNGSLDDSPRVLLWETLSGRCEMVNSISLPKGSQIVNFTACKNDATNTDVLLVQAKLASRTILMAYNLANPAAPFLCHLLDESSTDKNGLSRVNAVVFNGSLSLLAVAANNGLAFFVESEEKDKRLQSNELSLFEQREALYQLHGESAKGKAITSLCRFTDSSDFIAGTEAGQLLLWRGRSCVQSMVVGDNGSQVSALKYNASTSSAICLLSDGKLFVVAPEKGIATSKMPSDLKLTIRVQLDVTLVNIVASSLRGIASSYDGTKALVFTTTGVMHELSLVGEKQLSSDEKAILIEPKTTDAEEEETPATDESNASVTRIGDDLNNGTIISGQLSSSSNIVGVCRAGPSQYLVYTLDGQLVMFTIPYSELSESQTDKNQHKMVKSFQFDSSIATVASSSSFIAVALADGQGNPARRGAVNILMASDLSFVTDLSTVCPVSPSDGNVLDMQFSMASQLIVLMEGGLHRIFSFVENVWSLQKTFRFDSAMRLDVASDGQYLRLYTADEHVHVLSLIPDTVIEQNLEGDEGETIKCDVVPNDSLPEIKDKEQLRGFNWPTTGSFLYSSDLKGLFSTRDIDGSRSIDRSPNMVAFSKDSDVFIALSPCPASASSDLSPFRKLHRMHHGDIAGVCFIDEGQALVTAGTDNIVIVWKITKDTDEPDVDPLSLTAEEEEAEEDSPEDNDNSELSVINEEGEDEDDIDGRALLSHLRSSKSKAKSASSRPTQSNKLPSSDLQLSWVFGYSCRLSRASVKYCHNGGRDDGAIVYPAGSLSVVYDKVAHSQRYSFAQDDEITCLDVSKNGDLVVTGQRGAGDILGVVWDPVSGAILQRLNCGPVNALSAVTFSPDGKYVIAASCDKYHTIVVFDWRHNKVIGNLQSGQSKILTIACSFEGFSNDSYKPNWLLRIVFGCVNGFLIGEIHRNTGVFSLQTGLFGAEMAGKRPMVSSACALPINMTENENEDGVIVSAPEEGSAEFLLALSDGSVGTIIRKEKKISTFTRIASQKGVGVTAIAAIRSTSATGSFRVVCAGKNGFVKILEGSGSETLQVLKEYNLYKPPSAKEMARGISDHGLHPLGRAKGFRSVCVDKFGRKVLYATAGGEIGEFDLETGRNVNKGPLVEGHYRFDLNAVASHPIRPHECCTVGDDCTLRTWSISPNHHLLGQIDLPLPGRAVSYSPNGQLIVVGLHQRKQETTRSCGIAIVSYLQGELRSVHVTNDASNDVTSVVFNPQGSKLFASSEDGNIYVYDALDNFKLVNTLENEKELDGKRLENLDMSEDGAVLVSFGSDGFVCGWNVDTLTKLSNQETQSHLSTSYWFHSEGRRGPNLDGIYETCDDNQVTCVSTWNQKDSARKMSLAITGDDQGALKLFSYPSKASHKYSFKEFKGHSKGGVAASSFLCGGESFVSIGRSDKLLIVWTVRIDENIDTKIVLDGNKRNQLNALVNAIPDGDFASSFLVHSVNMGNTNIPIGNPRPSLQLKLCSLNGFSRSAAPFFSHSISQNVTSSAFVSPSVVYCGAGSCGVATSYGPFIGIHFRGTQTTHCIQIHEGDEIYSSDRHVSHMCSNMTGKFIVAGTCSSKNSNRLGRLGVVNTLLHKLQTVLTDDIEGGVRYCTFSADGKTIACLGGDIVRSLYIFSSLSGEWSNDSALIYCGVVGYGDCSLCTILSHPAGILNGNSVDVITAGAGFLKKLSINGPNAVCETQIYEGVITSIVAVPFSGRYITGDEKGEVWIWRDTSREMRATAHSSCVSSLATFYSPMSEIQDNGVVSPVLAKPLMRGAAKSKNNKNSTANENREPTVKVGFVSASMDCIRVFHLQGKEGQPCMIQQQREMAVVAFAQRPAPLIPTSPLLGSSISSPRAQQNHTDRPFITTLAVDRTGSRVLATTSQRVVELAVDMGTDMGVGATEIIAGQNHNSSVIKLVAHPTNPNIVATITCTHMPNRESSGNISPTVEYAVNLWNLIPQGQDSTQKLVGRLALSSAVTSVSFLTSSKLVLGLRDNETTGQGRVSGAALFIDASEMLLEGQREGEGRIVLSVQHRITSIGAGGVTDVKFIPQLSGKTKLLAFANEDGLVYVYALQDGLGENAYVRHAELLVHPSSQSPASQVSAIDFSADGSLMRAFGPLPPGDGKIDVSYFILETKASESSKNTNSSLSWSLVTDNAILSDIRDKVQWCTHSSPATPLLRVLADQRILGGEASIASFSQCFDRGMNLAAVGHSDGQVRVYSVPGSVDDTPLIDASCHSSSGALTAFLGGGNSRLCTCGVTDGTLMVWDVVNK